VINTKKILCSLILIMLIAPSLALTDYQRGVLDGLSRGWFMAQKYDQAQAGNPVAYNQAVPIYNDWMKSIFGQNESLMLKPFNDAAQSQPYTLSKTITPVHGIDSSWNQTLLLSPQADANGLINGKPAELYDSWGPALSNF
jgi:hypothetical protein